MLRAFLTATLMLTAISYPLRGQGDVASAVARCASIEDDRDRLACYDAILGVRTATPPASTTGTGAWVVEEETNPLDDTKSSALSLAASSGHSRLNVPVTLVLRCLSGKTEAYIIWSDYLGTEAQVTTRIGGEEPRTARWTVSTDHTATFYPGDAVALIKALMMTNRYVAQVTPYSENPVTAVFDLEGIEGAVGVLRETCGW